MRRVLVTGASGFVGAPLVAALAEAGQAVRAATRDPGAISFPAGVDVVAVPDFRLPLDWPALLDGVDAVVHLAGIAHTGLKLDEAVYDRVIYGASADLAAACGAAGVRKLVFLSSVRAQSGPTADHVLREDDAPCPTDAYGRAKLKAEGAVRASAVAWTILRPVVVYGPGVKGNIAGLMRLANTPWPLPFGSFSNRRSLLGLDNLLSAILLALGEDAPARETFLVADPEPVTLAELVASLRAGFARPSRLVSVPTWPLAAILRMLGRDDVWQRLGGTLVVDPAKLIKAGWRPDPDTKAGLARMAKASSS